jgi:hypothetical protein
MLWLILLVIVIFLAFGAVGIRVALKVALSLFLLCVVLVAGYWIYHNSEEEASWNRIRPSDVQFDDLRLGIGNSGKLTGTVRNLSHQYTISSVELEIIVRDCVGSNCDVVGQTTEKLWDVSVPPGQVRAVDHHVYFSDLPPLRGTYQWNYQIKRVQSR